MSNIEDDIEKIKTFADYSQEVLNDMEYEKPVDVTITQKEVNAINNLLSEREQDKARIKELEEENLHWRGRYHLLSRKIDVIPKQKVKDKIEEYDKKMEEEVGRPNWIVTDRIVINVLEELLEEGK